jgi:hypothetical protein
MGNKAATNIGVKDVSVTITVSNTWQRFATEDPIRGALDFQNVGSHNMGIYRAPPGNAGVTPVPSGIGSAGVNTLLPSGSGTAKGGWIESNELWVIGTAGEALTVYLSPPLTT